MATASSNSVTPTSVLPEQQTIGIRLPSATARTINRDSSSSVGGVPSKYRSITPSSTSMIDSSSGSWISLRIDQGSGRVVRHVQRADHALEIMSVSDRHVQQHAGRSPQLLNRLISTAGKSMFSASILLMTIIRPSTGLARLVEHASRVDFDARLRVDDDQPPCRHPASRRSSVR